MSSLSGSSSPDPLHLASSPLAAHTYTRRSTGSPIAHSNPRASPSKSFLMDTGDARIKVTVEPVLYPGPRASQTPSKYPARPASRTTTIPLRTGESSSTKRLRQPTPAAHVDSSGLGVSRRSSRKRKGTPGSTKEIVERRNSRRHAHMTDFRNEQILGEDHAMDRAMFSEQSVPSSEVRRRRSLYPMRNQRNQRLSAARDDLDDALQDAIGGTSRASSYAGQDDYLASADVGAGAAGELTTANEDFTMITGESLASISFKANGTMLGSGAHDEDDDMEVVGQEHLTSSPPQKIMYPDITEQADEAKTPRPGVDYDAMNWKPTIPRAMHVDAQAEEADQDISISIEQGSGSQKPFVENDRELEVEPDFIRSSTQRSSPRSRHSASDPVPQDHATMGASNPEDQEADEEMHTEESPIAEEAQSDGEVSEVDDDIWAEEASRDIEDSAITTTTTRSQSFRGSRETGTQVTGTSKILPPVSAEQVDPPRRAKLPRTWRQTSGVDFSYADSPKQSRQAGNSALDQSQATAGQPEALQRTSGDEGESGRSSGVLTPPSTDDDDSQRRLHHDGEANGVPKSAAYSQNPPAENFMDGAGSDEEDEEADISGFTNPGAADTQLEAHHRFGREQGEEDDEDEEDEEDEDEDEVGDEVEDDTENDTEDDTGADEEVASPVTDSGSNALTPDESGEDTGFFWQNNFPQVYRSFGNETKPQTKKPVDLSAILRVDSSKVEEDESSQTRKPMVEPVATSQPKPQSSKSMSSVRRKPAIIATRGKLIETSPGNNSGHILPSPVRRSLLRSSKALDGGEPAQPPVIRKPAQPTLDERIEETVLLTDDSLASKDADQRQLINEIRAATPVAKKPAHERLAVLRETSQPSSAGEKPDDVSYEETDTTYKNSWPEHSYEENLNIESPQKLNVKFNDSTLSFRNEQEQQLPRPNLLAPRGPIKPLFERSANAIPSRSLNHTNEKNNVSDGPSTVNFIGKGKPAPIATQQENEGVFSRLSTSFWSAVARPQAPPPTPAPFARTTEQTISLSLRAQLRSRYGVLPNSQPWTMAHMRTLHRMLNSVESGRRDSIVPTHSSLPSHLTDIIAEGRLSATGRSFRFEESHACVVQAFLQLLVTPALYSSMERGEVEWLGDTQAVHLRGEMGGRSGNELCFKTLKPKCGLIVWEWVVECLGCCVISNVEQGMQRVGVRVEREGTARDVEMSVMGDGQGEGRVREWFERESGRMAA